MTTIVTPMGAAVAVGAEGFNPGDIVTTIVTAIEELTDYRETADDPIHDFPYALLQENIAYKTTEELIPVLSVNPKNTSITCRQCETTNPQFRDGAEFECWDCGYEVHADVNAAMNIAQRID